MTKLINEADIVNKTRPLFTLSMEMTRLVNETRLLLVPSVNSDIYGIWVLIAYGSSSSCSEHFNCSTIERMTTISKLCGQSSRYHCHIPSNLTQLKAFLPGPI